MANKPYRTDRPTSRRVRDGAILVTLITVLGLAVIGLTSGAAFVMGVQVLDSGSPASHAAPPDTNSILRHARAKAARIIRQAEAKATSQQSSIVRRARRRAVTIIHWAKVRARKLENKARRWRHSHTPTPTPTSIPVAHPTPTTTGSLPYVGNVPAAWIIVAYQSNPTTGLIYIENRKYHSYSGTASMVFSGANGNALGIRSGHFHNLPGRSTTVVSVGSPPVGWANYRVSISGLH